MGLLPEEQAGTAGCSRGNGYYDPAGGMLYLWCPANADPASRYVELPCTSRVYVGWQRHDVRMEDLQFRHQSGPAVRLSGTSGIEVDGCEFRDPPSGHLPARGNSDYHHLVIENTFATAMYLLDNNSTVDHCQLNDIALHPDWARATGATSASGHGKRHGVQQQSSGAYRIHRHGDRTEFPGRA